MTLTFDIAHSGEMEAGLRPFTDTVIVAVVSGDPGGVTDEFAQYMCETLGQWYDGASVTLREEPK